MTPLDQSLTAFEDYKRNLTVLTGEDISESDTRSKLIDYLLIKVLGWTEEDIRREGHVDSGYYDYKISIPGIHFIVEAKRQFKEFSLPKNHKKASLKALYKSNKALIDQIRNYGLDVGIPYGILTNGYQIILLKVFNTDGTSWMENQCLIFDGVDDIERRFVEFFENISRFAIINYGGFKFDLPISNIDSRTILNSIVDKDKELIRNSLSASITPIIDKIFGEIFSEEREDDEEFIKRCFVENEETKKNKSEIERLFGDYAPQLNNVIPAINSISIANQIKDEIDDDEINVKNNYPPKPIILIGSKGAGKTTFINHLFKYRLEDEELENHFIIYIDFRKFFEGRSFFEPKEIAEEILESIYNKYDDLALHSMKVLKRIYFKEIRRNDESIWEYDKFNNSGAYNDKLAVFLEQSKSDPFSHLEKLSKYLIRERRKRLIVIIDNADQFKDPIQEQLFLFAHSLTKSTLCGTVISLREGYYYRWQNSPPFDAYESNVYHITAPKYSEVLQKRIDFAIEKAAALDKKVKGSNQKGINFEFSSEYIVAFLSGLKNSIFSEENTGLIDFLNFTTYPNIREGLRIFKSFLTSGHTNVDEYILREKYRSQQRSSHSTIPIHEFFKSIALRNRHYYNSEISIVYNLFTPPVDSTDHFVKLYILRDLEEAIRLRSYTEKLISHKVIVEKLSALGYRINTINSALTSLIKSSLIETDEQLSDVDWVDLPNEFNISLTAKGHYYLKQIIYWFHYLDLVLQDTPIFDSNEFENIVSSFPFSSEKGKRNMFGRKDSVHKFLNYLKLMESKQSSQTRAVYGNLVDEIIARVVGVGFLKNSQDSPVKTE
ncbi:AAA family ATPase [Pseudocnuella soli]|uniref:AAA family ATPase n=1 Tax=Pseudocnuella soli TaxID=2502779 RepID=UPI001044E3A0|nr:AAA family ATPase [Pseudocnuella soli]